MSDPQPQSLGAPHSAMRLIVRLMSGALLSKGLGFLREIVMALMIGTAVAADSFRTAITAVLLPISFFQAETVPAILIPMQKEKMQTGTAPQSLASLTAGLTLISLIIMLATQLCASNLVDIMVSGFSEQAKSLTIDFLHIMALAMPASVMLNCLAAGEIALGKARISNARAAIQNLGILIGLGLIALGGPVITLAWAFSLSFNGLALFAVVVLKAEGNLDFRGMSPAAILNAGREFFHRLAPFLSLPLAEQANIWLERFFTSRLQTGAVASLDYARTLTESFLLLISQPVGLAVLAGTSPQYQEQKARTIVRVVLAFSLPACAFLFVFAEDIVTIVFRRGAFGLSGVMLTSHALRGISIGLWASTLGWILLRLLNGANRNGRAAFILVSSYIANMMFNALMSKLAVSSISGISQIGLGESVRSLVLLFGVLSSLRPRIEFWPSFFRALLPALLVVVCAATVQACFQAIPLRLLSGCAILILSWLTAIIMLVPDIVSFVIKR